MSYFRYTLARYKIKYWSKKIAGKSFLSRRLFFSGRAYLEQQYGSINGFAEKIENMMKTEREEKKQMIFLLNGYVTAAPAFSFRYKDIQYMLRSTHYTHNITNRLITQNALGLCFS